MDTSLDTSLSRRRLIGGAFAAITLPNLRASPAEAGSLVTAFSYLLGGNLVLAVAELVENWWTSGSYSSSGNYSGFNRQLVAVNQKLSSFAGQINNIAVQQNSILQALAQQRIIMRQEIRAGFLGNDVAELAAMSQHYNVALSYDDPSSRQSAMQSIADRIGEKASKIATYGVPASAAYHAAIALENAVHVSLGTSPRVVKTINTGHYTNLNYILSGDGPDSLPQVIKANINPALLGLDPNSPLRQFDRFIPSWYYVKSLSNQRNATCTVYGFQYLGIKGGTPIYRWTKTSQQVLNKNYNPGTYLATPTTEFGYYENFTRDASNNLVPIQPIMRVAGHLIQVDSNGDPLIDNSGYPIEDTNLRELIRQQRVAINQFYRGLHFPRFAGVDILPSTVNSTITDGQIQMRQALVDGMSGVSRIILAANAKIGSQYGAGDAVPALGESPALLASSGVANSGSVPTLRFG